MFGELFRVKQPAMESKCQHTLLSKRCLSWKSFLLVSFSAIFCASCSPKTEAPKAAQCGWISSDSLSLMPWKTTPNITYIRKNGSVRAGISELERQYSSYLDDIEVTIGFRPFFSTNPEVRGSINIIEYCGEISENCVNYIDPEIHNLSKKEGWVQFWSKKMSITIEGKMVDWMFPPDEPSPFGWGGAIARHLHPVTPGVPSLENVRGYVFYYQGRDWPSQGSVSAYCLIDEAWSEEKKERNIVECIFRGLGFPFFVEQVSRSYSSPMPVGEVMFDKPFALSDQDLACLRLMYNDVSNKQEDRQ